MAQVGSQEGKTDTEGRPARPGLLRLVAAWSRLVIGLAFVGEGGVLYADARMHWAGHGAWVGAAAALVGALLGLSGICGVYAHLRPKATASEDLPTAAEPSLPLLGAVLIYKFRFVSEEQLAAALELQRKDGPVKRLIGGILLDMGVLSMAELQQALDYQRSLTGQMLRAPVAGDSEAATDSSEQLALVGDTEAATVES
jgi:hypothetical protein